MPQKSVRKTWESRTPTKFRLPSPQQEARYQARGEPKDEPSCKVAGFPDGQPITKEPEESGRKKGDTMRREAERRKTRDTRIGYLKTAEADRKRRDTLIGQLKAAEARNRIRQFRLRYQSIKAKEISLMVSCQATAQNAIRLQNLLPVKENKSHIQDTLDKLQRRRVEELLDDEGERFLTRR
ncbi:protein LKAAEAR1-like [Arapaima gigas]